MPKSLDNFIDSNGKLKQLPAKQAMRMLAYEYLASHFEAEIEYSEHEVNAIISSWNTFDDYFSLRRGLVDSGYLNRLPDGSKYWKNIEKLLNSDLPKIIRKGGERFEEEDGESWE